MRPMKRTATLGAALIAALVVAPRAHGHGAFHELIAAANTRIEKEPGTPDPLMQRAELYRHHGDYQAALADLATAAQLAPQDDRLDLLRGRTLADAGRPLAAK